MTQSDQGVDQLSRVSQAIVHFSIQARAGWMRACSQPLVVVRNTGVVRKDIFIYLVWFSWLRGGLFWIEWKYYPARDVLYMVQVHVSMEFTREAY